MLLIQIRSGFLRVCVMLLVLPEILSAQQDMSIYLQNNLVQSNIAGNPAGMTGYKIAAALPDLHLGVQNGSFHLGDMFAKTNQGEFFNLEKAISKMDETGNRHRSFCRSRSDPVFRSGIQKHWRAWPGTGMPRIRIRPSTFRR
jgi:hypothetical protein